MRQKLLAVLFAITLCGVGILAELSKPAPQLTFDENGNYTGFDSIPENYTVEQATRDGCVVNDYVHRENNHSAQSSIWRRFVTKSAAGQNTSVRIISYHSEEVGGGYSYQDLFFEDGLYYLFSSESKDLTRTGYGYLMELRDRMPNASRDSYAAILTWDKTVTYWDVAMELLSSSHYGPIKNYRRIFLSY